MAWEKGQSGNAAGRPKGSRARLSEAFVNDVQEDWKLHGIATLQRVRQDDPSTYLRVVASILPKEIEVEIGEGLVALLGELSQLGSSGNKPGPSVIEAQPVEDPGTGTVRH